MELSSRKRPTHGQKLLCRAHLQPFLTRPAADKNATLCAPFLLSLPPHLTREPKAMSKDQALSVSRQWVWNRCELPSRDILKELVVEDVDLLPRTLCHGEEDHVKKHMLSIGGIGGSAWRPRAWRRCACAPISRRGRLNPTPPQPCKPSWGYKP